MFPAQAYGWFKQFILATLRKVSDMHRDVHFLKRWHSYSRHYTHALRDVTAHDQGNTFPPDGAGGRLSERNLHCIVCHETGSHNSLRTEISHIKFCFIILVSDFQLHRGDSLHDHLTSVPHFDVVLGGLQLRSLGVRNSCEDVHRDNVHVRSSIQQELNGMVHARQRSSHQVTFPGSRAYAAIIPRNFGFFLRFVVGDICARVFVWAHRLC